MHCGRVCAPNRAAQGRKRAAMTAPKPESTSATYRRCAAAVEKAINAIQENPSLYRNRTARNKLVELAAAAKQLDRLLDGNGSDDEDHFGEAFAARARHEGGGRRRARGLRGGGRRRRRALRRGDAGHRSGDVEPTPVPAGPPRWMLTQKKKIKHKSKKTSEREKEEGGACRRRGGGAAALPRDRDAAGRPRALAAADAARRPSPLPADPALFKPGGASSPPGVAASSAPSVR